jgi:uncharacterized membrane protein/NAD(P)-dependent dehydrogenase (short-subunit alcohol dehydrogenase family)
MSTAAERREQRLHRFFEITLLLKALFAAGEIVSAIGVYVVPLDAVSDFVGAITRAELAAHPRDIVAIHLAGWARNLSVGTQHFVALYLLTHGAAKLWVIVGLLRERLWYYPIALVVFTLFVGYQIYRYTLTHSVFLLLMTAVDLVVIGLTWHEYRYFARPATRAGLTRKPPRKPGKWAERTAAAASRSSGSRFLSFRSNMSDQTSSATITGTATRQLAGKVALITGASRGVGAAVAERFAAEGAHVVLVARTVGGLEERDDAIRAAGGSATLVPLDLRDFVKIDELATALYQRYGRLDILVGNAARFGTFTPMQHVTPEEWSEILDLGLTANWRLIRAMDPLLRMAPAGRAIFVTSRLARDAPPYYGVYAIAKAGLETMVRIYAGEVARTAVRINLIDPGVVRTRLRSAIFPGEDPAGLPPPESVTGAFLDLAAAECTRHGDIVEAPAFGAT